jgi:hypothetical protein
MPRRGESRHMHLPPAGPAGQLVLCVTDDYTMWLDFVVRMTVILAVSSGRHRLARS